MTNGFGAQPELPEYSVHLSTGNCPFTLMHTAPNTSAAKRRPLPTIPDTVTIFAEAGEKEVHTLMRITTARDAWRQTIHCRSPRHDH